MKLEKMNQVSVTEFMSKSKEEMYDMAVEMVEKYNRLVDICNDSAERMADLVDRHKVYTDALKNDIASKDAKIEKLEKEIEGRKECYTALKEPMDTKYISIEDHNNSVDLLNKEIERLNIYTANQKKVNHDLVTKVTLLEDENKMLGEKIRHQRENLDGINKTLEIRTKEKERLIDVKNSQEKEIEAHEEENARLSEKITSLKGTITELSHEIDNYKSWNASLHKDIKSEINNKNDLVDAYEKKYDEFENRIKELKEENARLEKLKKKEDDHGRAGFEEYIKYIISEEEGKFKAELNRKFSEEVSKISQKRTEEELAKVKGVGSIPCGEDAIE